MEIGGSRHHLAQDGAIRLSCYSLGFARPLPFEIGRIHRIHFVFDVESTPHRGEQRRDINAFGLLQTDLESSLVKRHAVLGQDLIKESEQ
ncbi:hypothetical protein ASG87_01580 [Frateuria sp. Soil773]|nr:hypothetical protein ASG87_01580 [Frateuria sp. Soil773]